MKKLYSIVASAIIGAFGFTANAQNELVVGDVKVGDLITLSDGSQWYVGSNEIPNGSFDLDPSENDNNIVGWTLGSNYDQMTVGNFLWFKDGGYDGGAYIQANKHTGAGGDGSVANHWPLQQNQRYYFSFYLAKNSQNNQYIPVITLTDQESTGGGQNETEGNYLIGMSGDTSDGCLGFANFLDEDGDGVGEWCQTACSFDSREFTWLQFNARWLKENKIQACFDGFFLAKLYSPEDMTAEQVAFMALQSVINDAYAFAENQLGDYESLAAELGDFIQEGGFEEYTESASLEELQGAIDELHKKIESYQAVLPMINSFQKRFDEAMVLLEEGACPDGVDALQEVLSALGEWADNGFANEEPDQMNAEAYIQKQIDTLNKAIEAYFQNATVGTDMTTFIDNPTFDVQGKWYKGSYTGGDQRLNTAPSGSSLPEGIGSCWNAWSNELDANTAVSISQDIIGLPNGYYTVTAQMLTQTGLITNQHLFVTSTTGTAVSPVMTIDGWDSGEWETLTTEKVLVTDGKLTIGATGCGDNEEKSTRGWFCVTDFKLTYQGSATEEEMAAAVAATFADAESRTIHFAADNAAYKAAVAEAKAANDLDALKAAAAEADKSEAEYNGVLAGSYKQLQDSIATSELYSDNAKKLAKVTVDHMTAYLACDTASYKYSPAKTEIQRIYLNELIPALQNAEKAAEETANAEAKAFISTGIENYVIALTPYTADKDYLYAQKAELEKVLQTASLMNIEIADGADLTAYIANATVNDQNANGWTVKKYVGNTNAAKGQQYDGDGNGCYLDTWDGTAGKTRCTWYQVLNVPNGQYIFSALMRTSGEGAYLFASDKNVITLDNDTTALDPTSKIVLAEAAVVSTPNAKYGIIAEDETTAYTDTYGELWMAAADRVIAALGITPFEGSTIYDLAVDANDGSEDCPANVDATDWNIIKANSGKGRGWFNNSLEIEVKNHVLVLGMTCDAAFIKADEACEVGPKAWTGTWLSGDNFKLTLVKAGDNAGWNVVSGIETTVAAGAQATAIYTVGGIKTGKLQKGINIVKMSDGSVVKIMK